MIRFADIVLLAHRIFRDARAEPEIGRAAIAWTFLNRAAAAARHYRLHGGPHPQFGDGSVRAACHLASGQARTPLPLLPVNDPAFCRALATACLASCRDIADPTKGATHYHHHRDSPCWSNDLRPVALIGSFIFYRPHRG